MFSYERGTPVGSLTTFSCQGPYGGPGGGGAVSYQRGTPVCEDDDS